jgi:hypothetical protein
MSAELPYTVPISSELRSVVVQQVLTTLPFLLTQTSASLAELQRWRGGLLEHERAYRDARGGRPAPPRGFVRRRAIKYLERMEGLLEGVRVASLHTVVHSALIILGPTTLAPRAVIHVAFPPLDGDTQAFPTAPIRPSTVRWGGGGGGGGGERGEAAAGEAHHPTPTLTPPTAPIPAWYLEPLTKDIGGAVARKAARMLLTEGPTLFGMQSFPTILPIHVMILASPMHRAPSTTTTTTTTTAAGEEGGGSIGGSGGEVEGEGMLAPPGWLPRPSFSLKPQRNGLKRGRERYSLHQVRVLQGPAAPTPLVAGDTAAVGGSSLGLGLEGEGGGKVVGGPCWYQWSAPPKGFKGVLPPHPTAKKPRQQGNETI